MSKNVNFQEEPEIQTFEQLSPESFNTVKRRMVEDLSSESNQEESNQVRVKNNNKKLNKDLISSTY